MPPSNPNNAPAKRHLQRRLAASENRQGVIDLELKPQPHNEQDRKGNRQISIVDDVSHDANIL